MSELFYLDEKNYENVVHSYKSIMPKSVTSEEIIYDFPNGDYMIDQFYLIIKFDGDSIPQHNLTLEDFCDSIEPYYDNNGEINGGTLWYLQGSIDESAQHLYDSYCTKPIDATFATAYTEICKLNKNKLCFSIPLLRMVSIYNQVTGFASYKFIKRPHLKLVRQKKYNVDAVSIFQEMKNVNLENMPSEVLNGITNYAESKMQFELFYRETKFYTGIGKLVPPELVDTYTLDKYCVKFDNTDTSTITIADPTTQYNYKNMLIVVDLESHSASLLEQCDEITTNTINNYIKEITLQTKFSSSLNVDRMQFTKLFKDGIFKMTKEYAEIFGINYMVSSRYYLLDISNFIKVYIQSLTQNGGLYNHVHHYNHFACRVEKLYEQRIEQYQKPVDEFLNEDEKENDKLVTEMGLVLELTMVLNKADQGTAQVYLF